MGGYAPASLKWLGDKVEDAIASAVISGIVAGPNSGDSYHQAAMDLWVGSYTRQLEGDRVGIDMSASCALDISMSTADMITVTKRFHVSWKDQNDPRLNGVREFIGTLDGRTVTYMDCQSGQYGSADDSHLWHAHVGGLRRDILTMACVRAILSVWIGQTYAQYLAGGGTGTTPPSSGGTTMSDYTPFGRPPAVGDRGDSVLLADLWHQLLREDSPYTPGNPAPFIVRQRRIEGKVDQALAELKAFRGESAVRFAESAAREQAMGVALGMTNKALEQLTKGGTSIDTAAVLTAVGKVGETAAATQARIVELETETEQLHAELTSLREQLARAAHAEADALDG